MLESVGWRTLVEDRRLNGVLLDGVVMLSHLCHRLLACVGRSMPLLEFLSACGGSGVDQHRMRNGHALRVSFVCHRSACADGDQRRNDDIRTVHQQFWVSSPMKHLVSSLRGVFPMITTLFLFLSAIYISREATFILGYICSSSIVIGNNYVSIAQKINEISSGSLEKQMIQ